MREPSLLVQSMMDCYDRHNRSMARLPRITILGAEAIALTLDRCGRLVSAELAGAHLLVVQVDETDGLAMTRAHLETRGSFDAIAHQKITDSGKCRRLGRGHGFIALAEIGRQVERHADWPGRA